MAMKEYGLYIDGTYEESCSGRYIEVENPATKEVFARVPDGNGEDVDRAAAAARKAFPAWSALSPQERAGYLDRFAGYIEGHSADIGKTITAEIGTPVSFVFDMQVESSIQQGRYYADIARNYRYEEMVGDDMMVRKEPIGVIACLTPWNYPLYQETSKIFPAMAAGNCVVLKPSQIAPVSAFVLAEAADEAGLPPGVMNIVTGRGGEVGALLAEHEDVDMVSFTGSTEQGKKVGMSGIGSNVKKVALELGGKSAAVILRSADMEKAADDIMAGCFFNTGQICSALSRMLAPVEMKDRLEEYIVSTIENYIVGDPEDEKVMIGPLASRKGFDKVCGYISLGLEEGARMLAGSIPDGCDGGYYVSPVVFTDVTRDMVIAREEIFGPVLSIIYYESEDEALEIANDSIYGLAGAVFGEEAEALEFAKKMRAGTINVNNGNFSIEVPFGGYKQSGLGRENGAAGFDEFMEIKSVML